MSVPDIFTDEPGIVAAIVSVVTLVATRYGFQLSPDVVTAITAGVTVLANLAARSLTRPAAKSVPAPAKPVDPAPVAPAQPPAAA